MSIAPSAVVSIHPYFRVHPGKMEEFKKLLPEFIACTENEEACLYYHFSIKDDVVNCREAYVGGEGILTHLSNVGEVLGRAAEISDLFRLELHGAPQELAKIKAAFEGLNAEHYEFVCGLGE